MGWLGLHVHVRPKAETGPRTYYEIWTYYQRNSIATKAYCKHARANTMYKQGGQWEWTWKPEEEYIGWDAIAISTSCSALQ